MMQKELAFYLLERPVALMIRFNQRTLKYPLWFRRYSIETGIIQVARLLEHLLRRKVVTIRVKRLLRAYPSLSFDLRDQSSHVLRSFHGHKSLVTLHLEFTHLLGYAWKEYLVRGLPRTLKGGLSRSVCIGLLLESGLSRLILIEVGLLWLRLVSLVLDGLHLVDYLITLLLVRKRVSSQVPGNFV